MTSSSQSQGSEEWTAALEGLANAEGLVSSDALREVPGFDESILVSLEEKLGPGPWPLEDFSAFLISFLSGESGASSQCLWLSPERRETPLTPPKRRRILEDAGVPKSSDCSEDEALQRAASRLVHQLSEAVETALEAEEFGEASTFRCQVDEGEWDDVEDRFRQLGLILSKQDAVNTEVLKDMLGLISSTWCLASRRQQQLRRLYKEMTKASGLAAQSSQENQEAREALDASEAMLRSAHEALQSKEAELLESHRQQEELEERLALALQQHQQARDSADDRKSKEDLASLHSAETEQEPRLEEGFSSPEGPCEVRGNFALRRRLEEAELELRVLREELLLSEQRCDDLQRVGEIQVTSLQGELEEQRSQPWRR